jgi:nucleotide-binding universal stress UspA family protein
MSTTGPIVVGVDGSPAAERALRWALDEARIRGCEVHVVHAWVFEPLGEWALLGEQDVRAQSEALVDEVVRAALVGRTDPPVIVRHSACGAPADVLVRMAADAALLVVAGHEGERLRKALLGSVSGACVRHSTVPVVVVPPPHPVADAPGAETENARSER